MAAANKLRKKQDVQRQWSVIQGQEERRYRAMMSMAGVDTFTSDKALFRLLDRTFESPAVKNPLVRQLTLDGIRYLGRVTRTKIPAHIHRKSAKVENVDEGRVARSNQVYNSLVTELMQINRLLVDEKYTEALKRGQNLARRILGQSDKSPGKASLLANCYCVMGNAHLGLGDAQKALTFHLDDFQLALQHDLMEAKGRALDNLARTYVSLENYSKAIEIWENKLHMFPTFEDKEEEIWQHHEMGNCYIMLGRLQDAKTSAQAALHLAEELGKKKWSTDSAFLLGKVELESCDLISARNSFIKSAKLAVSLEDEETYQGIVTVIHDLNSVLIEDGLLAESDILASMPPPFHKTIRDTGEETSSPSRTSKTVSFRDQESSAEVTVEDTQLQTQLNVNSRITDSHQKNKKTTKQKTLPTEIMRKKLLGKLTRGQFRKYSYVH